MTLDPIFEATMQYKRHPSIKLRMSSEDITFFYFHHQNFVTMLKIIQNLYSLLKKLLNKETSQSDSLRNTDLFFINFCLIFILTMLNKANIKPIYKKDDPFDKTNYKPTSTLQISSKAF